MRPAEVIVLAAGMLLSAWLLKSGRLSTWTARAAAVAMMAALLVHLIVEGLYWQMAAAYVAGLLLIAVLLAAAKVSRFAVRLAGGLALLLLVGSATALIVLPKFRLPQPTGPYAVGTRLLHVEDAARTDPTMASGHRELMVQVWYSAEKSQAPLAPYRRAMETTWLSSYDAALKTHSRVDAPVLKGPWPLLLFNPAWQGERTQNTYETEEMASHGFVVAAIDHTHNSQPVAFPDGRIVVSSEPRDIEDFNGVSYEQQVAYGNAEVTTQARDDSAVLDALLAMNKEAASPWYQRLDPERIGVFGHSFGGAASVETAFLDPRVRAAVNMDGWLFGDLWKRNFDKPLMLFYEERFPPGGKESEAALKSADRNDRLIAQLDAEDASHVERTLAVCGGYVLTIHGARHFNFSDRALYSPVRRLTEAGPINPYRAFRIIDAYTLAFFEQTLNHADPPLLREPSPFEEVHLQAHSRETGCSAAPLVDQSVPPRADGSSSNSR